MSYWLSSQIYSKLRLHIYLKNKTYIFKRYRLNPHEYIYSYLAYASKRKEKKDWNEKKKDPIFDVVIFRN